MSTSFSVLCLLASAEAYVLAPTGPRAVTRAATPEMSLLSPMGLGAVAAGVGSSILAVRLSHHLHSYPACACEQLDALHNALKPLTYLPAIFHLHMLTRALLACMRQVKKFAPGLLPKKKEDANVAAFRSSLGSMDSMKELSELKLEEPEGKKGRIVGPWKEYIKSNGRKWYYNTETKIQTWNVPDEIKKLDEVSAAAVAANEARGAN